ncbi:hypothetical protein ETE54_00085 [Escherichia coli]|nr:hypothetical protein ETE54_00085 [Escherichia coli]
MGEYYVPWQEFVNSVGRPFRQYAQDMAQIRFRIDTVQTWPLYESRLKGKLHVISKRYTQRIERHNLNLRQHLARLGRKSLSFSKSVEQHDKVIGHYLNIKHYQ